MNANQQFSVSCHILVLLAASPAFPVTSEKIAESVDTNPVVIRRIMSHLRQNGMVDSRPGANGGWRLARPASQLSLHEVHQALTQETLFALHQHPNPDCPIGSRILPALESIFGDAQAAMELTLAKTTVGDLLDKTLGMEHLIEFKEVL